MKLTRRITAFLLTLLMAVALALPAWADAPTTQVTVLFTHDLHSHLLPANDESGSSYGGYARLKTAIDAQKAAHPGALVVDGGDFSMGSLFQTSFRTSAAELRVMAALGVDVTTFGNHEYDYGPVGLGDMLNAALDSGDPLPAIVETNFLPPAPGEEGDSEATRYAQAAFDRYGVEDYLLLERGGVWFAVFSSFGIDAQECAPTSGMILHDRFQSAQETVDRAREECLQANGVQPLVVCLSHSGTEGGKGEDYELAQKVKGIDLIISGHSHTTIQQPIQVGSTYIVSAGEYSKNLGVITLNYKPSGEVTLAGYELVPINDTLAEDAAISAQVQAYKAEVERDYLSLFGLSFDEVLSRNPHSFDSVSQVYATQHESTLCSLFTDAYQWAVAQATGTRPDVALTASGVIRGSLAKGDVTVSAVFDAASLGNGVSDVPGGAVVSVWLTGADLKTALEVDASIQPIMPAAQLFFSGVEYSYNTSRMIFNKVDYAMLRRADGSLEPIVDDQLYNVVTGTYVGNMLGSVGAKSFGLLSITPRNAQGDPIEDLSDYIVHTEDGSELKEWYAIASYIKSMGGEIDARYGQTDGRKVVYSSLSPVKMLRNANKFTIIAIAVILVLIAVIVLIVRAVIRKVRRKKNPGYRSYKGRK